MNQLASQVSVTTTVDNIRNTLSNNVNQSVSSSNFISSTVAVTGSGYTAISLGSLTDVTQITLVNDTSVYSSSIIQISGSGGGSGIANPIGATLLPGQTAVIPWSGSVVLSGKVVQSYPASLGTAQNGIIQYVAIQS